MASDVRYIDHYNSYLDSKWVGKGNELSAVVIDRLRELNVATAKTLLSWAAQKALAASLGDAQPAVEAIQGDADQVGEMRRRVKRAVDYD